MAARGKNDLPVQQKTETKKLGGRPRNPALQRYRWYSRDREPSFSVNHWWEKLKSEDWQKPLFDLHAAFLWESLRRHPDFPVLRQALADFGKKCEDDFDREYSFWETHGGPTVRNALREISDHWRQDFATYHDGFAEHLRDHPLRPWAKGYVRLGSYISQSPSASQSKVLVCRDMLRPSEPSPDSPGGWPRQSVHGIPTAFFAEPESEDGRKLEAFEEDQAAPHLRIHWSALKFKAAEVGMVPLLLVIDPHGSVEALSSEFKAEIEVYRHSPPLPKERVLNKGSFLRLGDLDDWVCNPKGETNLNMNSDPGPKAASDVVRKFDDSTRLELTKFIDDLLVAIS